VDPEDYFHAALDILTDFGPESLTAARLCERLNVTKGSFYHHFQGMDDFVESLADYRETIFNGLVSAVAAQPDPVARVTFAVSLIAALPHEAEAAIRAWSHSNKVLQASQRRVDRSTMSIAASTTSVFIDDPERSMCVARQTIALIIGLQQLEHPVDRAQLVHNLASFIELTWGLTATTTETTAGPVVEFTRTEAPNQN
jgi:AcrR family transcriptional regulator